MEIRRTEIGELKKEIQRRFEGRTREKCRREKAEKAEEANIPRRAYRIGHTHRSASVSLSAVALRPGQKADRYWNRSANW